MTNEINDLIVSAFDEYFKELLNLKINIENEIKNEFPNLNFYLNLSVLELYIIILSNDFNVKQILKLVNILEKFNYDYHYLELENNTFILNFFEKINGD